MRRLVAAMATAVSDRRVAGRLLAAYLVVVALIVFWPGADIASRRCTACGLC